MYQGLTSSIHMYVVYQIVCILYIDVCIEQKNVYYVPEKYHQKIARALRFFALYTYNFFLNILQTFRIVYLYLNI